LQVKVRQAPSTAVLKTALSSRYALATVTALTPGVDEILPPPQHVELSDLSQLAGVERGGEVTA
jgi:hypothetical protein